MKIRNFEQYCHNRGPSIKYVSIFEGGGVSGMLTFADMGGGGVSKMLTSALFVLKNQRKLELKSSIQPKIFIFKQYSETPI